MRHHQQAQVGQARECETHRPVPVRSLVACRYDSQSTVSTLSIGSEFTDPRTARTASIHRIDRFKASCTSTTDRGLGKGPNRKGSMHNVVSPSNSASEADEGSKHMLPPRIPSRQDTADRKMFAEAITTMEEEEGEDSSDSDRPGLRRASGGINLFGDRVLS